MRSRIASLTLGLALSAAAPLQAQTHFTLTSSGDNLNMTPGWMVYVGNFQALKGPATQAIRPTVTITCVDYFNDIYVGAEWDANLTALGTSNNVGTTTRVGDLNIYRQAAWISQQFGTASSLADISTMHLAIWQLTAGGQPNLPVLEGATQTVSYWIGQAQANYGSMNMAGWSVVTDVNSPGLQEVIMFDPTAVPTSTVPEPATVVLMASGLLGVVGFKRRMRKNKG